jgi:hypothetical protein
MGLQTQYSPFNYDNVVSRVAPSGYRNTNPRKNTTPHPSTSKDDTESKFTDNFGINNTSTNSKKSPDTS